MTKLLWDFETTRKALDMTEGALRWKIRTREIPGMVRIGKGRGKIYFKPEAIKAWIEENEIPVNGGE